MFILTEMKDTVKVTPWNFPKSQEEVITKTLNNKFAHKVVHNVGLCIALWDVTNVGDSFLFPGDGCHHTVVTFRFVVFRPFIDEILVGRIQSSDQDGIKVTMGFFDDIFVPASLFPHPSRFDQTEQVWLWEFGENNLYLDKGKSIRFRVYEEEFVDTTPTSTGVGETPVEVGNDDKKSPYSLKAAINENGLGLLEWWS